MGQVYFFWMRIQELGLMHPVTDSSDARHPATFTSTKPCTFCPFTRFTTSRRESIAHNPGKMLDDLSSRRPRHDPREWNRACFNTARFTGKIAD